MTFNQQTLHDLRRIREEIIREMDNLKARFRSEFEPLEKQLQAIEVLIPLPSLAEQKALVEAIETDAQAGSGKFLNAAILRGMKQMPALKTIARAHNGLVRTLEAKDLMVEAGVMKDSKHAYKMVYNLIKNSEDFEPTGNRGEYRLMDTTQPTLQ